MVELIAQGKEPGQRWRQVLAAGPITLGRTGDSTLRVPWDRKISRVHARLSWHEGRLHVHRDQRSLNPIFYQGQAREDFEVPAGGWFVIGDTAFLVVGEQSADGSAEPLPESELTLSTEELRRSRMIDPDARLEVLAGLPSVIRFSPSDAELNAQVTGVLLRGIPRAETAAIIALRYLTGPEASHPLVKDATPSQFGAKEGGGTPPTPGAEPRRADQPIIEIIQARNRDGLPAPFRPSRRLVREALEQRRQSVMYLWSKGEATPDYTQMAGCDWALCIPLDPEDERSSPAATGKDSNPGFTPPALGLYLTGTLSTFQRISSSRDDILRSDLKFTELVADIFAALRRMTGLQRQLGQMRNFLPHDVVNAMGAKPAGEVEEMLRPRVVEVTALFCDIRQSTRIAERGQDNLLQLWDSFSRLLAIMTSTVRNEGGIIADLQGDAIMAFWGWPASDDSSLARPVRAALAICQRLARESAGSPLGLVRCGIGIAHGNAVVGRLGTPDQFKIDAFGPTVNLAARLEALAKFFGVSIVVDQRTSEFLAGKTEELSACVRRLGRVQPAGMELVMDIAELAPASHSRPAAAPEAALALTEQTIRFYEMGLQAFEQGRWSETRALLESIRGDRPAARLLEFMARYPAGPPADWDGVLRIDVR